MKTKEELNTLKEEIDTLNKKLAELTDEELKQVAGGSPYGIGEEDSPEEILDFEGEYTRDFK